MALKSGQAPRLESSKRQCLGMNALTTGADGPHSTSRGPVLIKTHPDHGSRLMDLIKKPGSTISAAPTSNLSGAPRPDSASLPVGPSRSVGPSLLAVLGLTPPVAQPGPTPVASLASPPVPQFVVPPANTAQVVHFADPSAKRVSKVRPSSTPFVPIAHVTKEERIEMLIRQEEEDIRGRGEELREFIDDTYMPRGGTRRGWHFDSTTHCFQRGPGKPVSGASQRLVHLFDRHFGSVHRQPVLSFLNAALELRPLFEASLISDAMMRDTAIQRLSVVRRLDFHSLAHVLCLFVLTARASFFLWSAA